MRLSEYLLEKKLLDTKSQIEYFVKSGKVNVNGKPAMKPSMMLYKNDKVEIIPEIIYSSKGGYKLEAFLKKISFSVKDKIILDVGCSTGGFTHYFLTHDARKVTAIDIAKEILSDKVKSLRPDDLKYWDGFDALDKDNLQKLSEHKFDVISIDVSDRSIKDVLLAVKDLLKKKGSIIALFKPHYEGKKGIVSKEDKKDIAKKFEEWLLKETPYKEIHKINSSERGGSNLKGNREIFYLLKFR